MARTFVVPGLLARIAALGAEPVVVVDDDVVRVRAGLTADIRRSSIVSARLGRTSVFDGIGIHGWRSRWVVNGRMGRAAVLRMNPPVRARLFGVPLRIRMLLLVVDDPAALVAEVGRP